MDWHENRGCECLEFPPRLTGQGVIGSHDPGVDRGHEIRALPRLCETRADSDQFLNAGAVLAPARSARQHPEAGRALVELVLPRVRPVGYCADDGATRSRFSHP